MAQCTVRTATLVGVEAVPVDVEVDVGPGLPSFAVVGLPDLAVQEARERVRSALRASGFELPNARVIVNLAPGPLRKHGTGFDLPIAIGLLGATGQLSRELIESVMAVGELSLDGSVRSVPGLLAHGLCARASGVALLTAPDAGESSIVKGLEFRALRSLSRLRQGLPDTGQDERTPHERDRDLDYRDVRGQAMAVRALTVAAAGGHNVLLIGPPGSGKTMLARRLPTILPPLSDEERLETALVHSVAGLDSTKALAGIRPFRAPHHSASIAGLIGGGSPPRPGEASLAHNGVLFLDEMPEFGPAALQTMRQPLEDGCIVLVRAEGRVALPARFALVGAANPCPCGFYGDPASPCRCAEHVVARYRNRIGGPLMDRIDLVIEVARPDPQRVLGDEVTDDSASLAALVRDARARANRRGAPPSSALSGAELLADCRLSPHARSTLEQIAVSARLSGRGITRLLRVARTLADMDGVAGVDVNHLDEARGFRSEGMS